MWVISGHLWFSQQKTRIVVTYLFFNVVEGKIFTALSSSPIQDVTLSRSSRENVVSVVWKCNCTTFAPVLVRNRHERKLIPRR